MQSKQPEPDNRPAILKGLALHDVGTSHPEFCYKRSELLRPGVTATELVTDQAWLFLQQRHDGTFVEFAVLEFYVQDDDDTYLQCVWAGEGTGGALRELRHSWFGENQGGYVFYLRLDTMIAACQALQEYFDSQ